MKLLTSLCFNAVTKASWSNLRWHIIETCNEMTTLMVSNHGTFLLMTVGYYSKYWIIKCFLHMWIIWTQQLFVTISLGFQLKVSVLFLHPLLHKRVIVIFIFKPIVKETDIIRANNERLFTRLEIAVWYPAVKHVMDGWFQSVNY